MSIFPVRLAPLLDHHPPDPMQAAPYPPYPPSPPAPPPGRRSPNTRPIWPQEGAAPPVARPSFWPTALRPTPSPFPRTQSNCRVCLKRPMCPPPEDARVPHLLLRFMCEHCRAHITRIAAETAQLSGQHYGRVLDDLLTKVIRITLPHQPTS